MWVLCLQDLSGSNTILEGVVHDWCHVAPHSFGSTLSRTFEAGTWT